MLNGIDVSVYQPGSVPLQVGADFCIVKATGGTGYINPNAAQQILTGPDRNALYHFAGDGYPWTTPEAEAQHFLNSWRLLAEPGTIPILDWETSERAPIPIWDVDWAYRWLDIVAGATGKVPLLYCNKSVAEAYDWSRVRGLGVKLWLAWYLDDAPIAGYQPPYDLDGDFDSSEATYDSLDISFGAVDGWGTPAIWQYSQHGRLPGYDGDLDLNIAYEDIWATTYRDLVPGVKVRVA